jgi:ATP-dependent helicase/nuclease subunit A
MATTLNLFEPRIIRASAGSGKTFALSSRCVDLLGAKVPANSILATTFTRKAAGEIYARVLLRLASATSSEIALKELNQTADTAISKPEAERILLALLRQPQQFRVCTLDSFFSSIASSFQFELGLPDSWSIAEADEQKKLQEETIRELCAQAHATDLENLLHEFNTGEARQSVLKELNKRLPQLYELYRSSSELAWHWLKAQQLKSSAVIDSVLTELKQLPIPQSKQGPLESWIKSIQHGVDSIQHCDWNSFLEKGLGKAVLEGKTTFYKREIDPEMLEIFKSLCAHALQSLLAARIQKQNALYDLLGTYGKILERLREERGILDFNDIKFRLWSGTILGNLEELYYRLSSRIDHILLDEFQDTSLGQWQVLEHLCAEVLSAPGEPRSFFCVGDAKQAIYGWRGGSAEIFENLEKIFPILSGKSLALDESRRSAPVIIDTVNSLFAGLLQLPEVQAFPTITTAWSQRFRAHKTHRSEAPGYVELRHIPVENDAGSTKENATIRLACELHLQHPTASIGILVRRNETIDALLSQCSRSETFIRASGEGGNPLSDSPAVVVLLSALELCDHPANSILRFVVAESPLGAALHYTDAQASPTALCDKLRKVMIKDGLGHCVRNLAALLEAAYAPRDTRRLQQLTELAYQFESNTSLRFSDFCARARATRREDKDQASLRIMTVHQAKGLEFDIVILPELEQDLLSIKPDSILTWSESVFSPPTRVSLYPNAVLRQASPELQEIYDAQQARQLSEGLSLLYVAVTRPRHALFMLTWDEKTRGPRGLTAANMLLTVLGNQSQANAAESVIRFQNGDVTLGGIFSSQSKNAEGKTVQLSQEVIAPAPKLRRKILPRKHAADLSKGSTAPEILERIARFTPAARGAMEYGKKLHAQFQQIEWLDKNTQACSKSSNLSDAANKLLLQPALYAVFDKAQYQSKAERFEVFREIPFALRHDDSLLNGIVDRLVVGYNGTTAVFADIIDFKTDNLSSADDLAITTKVGSYSQQLRFYAEAISNLFEIDIRTIQARLVFVGTARIVEIAP